MVRNKQIPYHDSFLAQDSAVSFYELATTGGITDILFMLNGH